MSAMADLDNVFPHVSHDLPAGGSARRDYFMIRPVLWLCLRLSAASHRRILPAAASSAAGFRPDSSRSRGISPWPHTIRSFAFRAAVSIGHPAAAQ